MDYYILAVNPDANATKLGVYKNEERLFKDKIFHPEDELNFFEDFYDQAHFRAMIVMDSLKRHGFDPSLLTCVAGRGGKLLPVEIGGYKINDEMISYLKESIATPHVTNLGCMIAKEIGDDLGIPSIIYDGVSACSFIPEAEVEGIPLIKKTPYCHVLNSRLAAVKYAHERNKHYEDVKLVIANMGTGTTVSAHYNGKIIDVLSDDDGPMSPERSGRVPLIPFLDLCFDGKYKKRDIEKMVRKEGGVKAYLGTGDMKEVEELIKKGDEKAILISNAMVYQIAKAIGCMAASMKGEAEAILLTGGVANSEYFTEEIKKYVSFLAPVYVYPGAHEVEALAMGALRILNGEETLHEFKL